MNPRLRDWIPFIDHVILPQIPDTYAPEKILVNYIVKKKNNSLRLTHQSLPS